ncbi:MAG: DUF58 domain-containing protein [Treponemataceae bacterium]|nr:DUF58 domain-containing protein [Treponemataceae bacterium]
MRNLLSGSHETLSKKAACLRLTAASLAESMKLGGFRSLYRGQGVDFCGVREYLRGDDVRAIDWNVTARMGRPFVKLFEEERELQLFLIVDRSASMFVGGGTRTKYEAAAEAAALLTLAAEWNGSPVGAVFFDGAIGFSCAPESGRNRTMLLLSRLDEASRIESGSVLGNAIAGAARLLKNHAVVFVLSDFRSAGWEEPFRLLAQKNEAVAVRISDAALPEAGALPCIDGETGVRTVLPTNSAPCRAAWSDFDRRKASRIQDFCFRHGAGFLSLSTEDDSFRALSAFFAVKGRPQTAGR